MQNGEEHLEKRVMFHEVLLSSSTNFSNCGQCKMIYGEYFNGRQCAEECVSTSGFIQPDCDEADTIVKYLRRKP